MAKSTLDADILTAALIGFEVQKARIDAQIAEIRSRIGGGNKRSGAAAGSGRPKRHVSAAARRRMARAQRLRWKKVKQGAQQEKAASAKPKKASSARKASKKAPGPEAGPASTR